MCDTCNNISCTGCTSSLTGGIVFDGTEFICTVGGGEQFTITPGDNLNVVLALLSNQLCGLYNDVNDGVLDGSEWFVGSGAPNDANNNDGDLYLDSDTGDVYKKDSGTWGSPVANIKGDTGLTGNDGNNGSQGLSFRQGAGVPSPALGNDGDTYVNLTSPELDLYTKSGGTWSDSGLNMRGVDGTNGTNGTNGTAGSDGFNFHQGVGVPSGALGNDNDSYFDSATGDLYKKTTGVWNITANFPGGTIAVAYGFRSESTASNSPNFGTVSGIGLGTDSDPFLFPDDFTPPSYDSGNDWYTDVYIVPINGIKQKFIVENVAWSVDPSSVGNGDVIFEIQVNGVAIPGALNAVTVATIFPAGGGGATSGLIPSIVTDYVTLSVGDVVRFVARKTNGSGNSYVVHSSPGVIISNSFEV
jgi:hypothetical protein